MKGLPLLLTGVFFFSCQTNSPNRVRVATFKTENGYGFRIEGKEKVLINQPFIPGIEGVHAFKTADDAFKTGNLVLEKIRNKRSPGITVEELDSLEVDYPGNNKKK
ncbi:MAG: DUF4907 domain-containing protein [Prolixibacteraceae bacterium]